MGIWRKMGFAMGMMDALKCKDAEDVLIQKSEVKRRECVCLFGAGAWVSELPLLSLVN
jgi:hypothetical protein